ncbi:MAG: ABC transporter substrate-binding protein [Clostridia bacterium]|nr:ABC transporter substrate-binding protein [Clostridia bacterium]
MKKFIALMLSVIMLLAFAGCSEINNNNEESSSDDAGNTASLTKITFALDWTPNTNHTGLYVAKELGYFEDAGLDVEIVYVADSSSTTLCATGNAQFAIEAQDTMAAALTGDSPLGITAVAAILQHNTSGIISRKGEGIDSPKGLSGKTYSTWDSPVELAMLESVVETDGGNFDDVKLIPNTVTDEPGALAAKQTDAIWVFYGWGGINADVQDFEYDFFFFKDIDDVFDYYTPIIIGNNEYMEANPETTKAFLAAAKKGYEYAAQNPDESAQILIDADNTGSLKGSEELVKQSQKWISTQYIADAESWGVIDADRWNAFYNWLNENDLVENDIPEGTGFTNEYLN